MDKSLLISSFVYKWREKRKRLIPTSKPMMISFSRDFSNDKNWLHLGAFFLLFSLICLGWFCSALTFHVFIFYSTCHLCLIIQYSSNTLNTVHCWPDLGMMEGWVKGEWRMSKVASLHSTNGPKREDIKFTMLLSNKSSHLRGRK